MSHAADDKDLVQAFELLLRNYLGIQASDIFCSSLEGQDVPVGGSFVDHIKEEVRQSKAVVALISPAYLDSVFCTAELGAAWALGTYRSPIIVPPNDFSAMKATLLGIVGVSLENNLALQEALDQLSTHIGSTPPKGAVKTRAMEAFTKAWGDLKTKIAGPKRVQADVHARVVAERDQAIQALQKSQNDLEKCRLYAAEVEKTKDKVIIKGIKEKMDPPTWRDELSKAIGEFEAARFEVGSHYISRLLVLDKLGKDILPDFREYPDDVRRAVETDIFDEENKSWNYKNGDVIALQNAVDNIIAVFDENSEASKEYKALGKRNDPRNIKFWEEI